VPPKRRARIFPCLFEAGSTSGTQVAQTAVASNDALSNSQVSSSRADVDVPQPESVF